MSDIVTLLRKNRVMMMNHGEPAGFPTAGEQEDGHEDQSQRIGGMERRPEGRQGRDLHPERRAGRASLWFCDALRRGAGQQSRRTDRTSDGEGKRVSVRVDLGGSRILQKKVYISTRLTRNDRRQEDQRSTCS